MKKLALIITLLSLFVPLIAYAIRRYSWKKKKKPYSIEEFS